MACLKNLLVSGVARINGTLYGGGIVPGYTTVTNTSGTIQLSPGKYTVVGTITGDVEFVIPDNNSPGAEYCGEFTVGSEMFSITIPGSPVEGRPTIRKDHKYLFSIQNGVLILVEVVL